MLLKQVQRERNLPIAPGMGASEQEIKGAIEFVVCREAGGGDPGRVIESSHHGETTCDTRRDRKQRIR